MKLDMSIKWLGSTLKRTTYHSKSHKHQKYLNPYLLSKLKPEACERESLKSAIEINALETRMNESEIYVKRFCMLINRAQCVMYVAAETDRHASRCGPLAIDLTHATLKPTECCNLRGISY